MKKTNDYGRDSIPLLVLKTSVPFMLAQLVNVLYSIVDRIYVGNIPVIGADSLAGAGVCAPIITLLSSFGTLVGIGGSVLFSVRLGAGDEKSARRILANSFSLLLILSAILTVVFLLTIELLTFLYFLIFLLATPDACLPTEPWRQLAYALGGGRV